MSKTPAAPAPYADRIERLRAACRQRKLDGYLLLNRMDQIWLTGFTGEDGAVLVNERHVVLLTDGRFDETADREAPFARKVLRTSRTPDITAREIRRLKIARLGFDPRHMNVQTFAELRKALKGSRLNAASALISDMRRIKDPGETARIRRAIEIAEQAFQNLLEWLRPGMTEREVAARLVYDMQSRGAQEAAFQPIVAVGPNASLPHYEPGERRVTQREGVLIDWGARCDWYVSDLTRMVWPGSIPPELAKVCKTVLEALELATAAIKPGVPAAKIDQAARAHITQAGFGKQFTHSTGHGIGLDVHEDPGLRKRNKLPLEAGMVVTVEPGIYLPGVGGVRIENDVLVTETGHEVLSALPATVRVR
ncbi:MAG: Aminopeptidase YpdF [Phycisphaerae bacterium]|nr:Aminopeptidase YpdF [Phycisphaerae bacterium]